MSDLPALVERLRQARPELAKRLPVFTNDFRDPVKRWWTPQKTDLHASWPLPAEAARDIVIGVCAEVLADACAYTVKESDGHTTVFDQGDMEGAVVLADAPDFLTAIVSAVIALPREADRG